MKPSQLEILPRLEKEKNQKKARILVAVFLGATLIPSVLFWLAAGFREKRFKILKPKISFNFQEKNLLEKRKSDLAAKLDQWAGKELTQIPGQWSVEIRFLENDFSWGFNEKKQLTAASLIKLPVAAAFYHQVESGKLDSDQVYLLKEEDKVGGAGSLFYQPSGTEITLGEMVRLSLSQSDNTAFKILRKTLGDNLINSLMIQWQMIKTDLEENLTSAEEIGSFFHQLYQGKIVGEEFKEKILDHLTKTVFEDRIPAGVPEGIRVAHKVGTEAGVVSDGGIIYLPENPFILVILSQETDQNLAKEKFPRLVSDLYWLVSNF